MALSGGRRERPDYWFVFVFDSPDVFSYSYFTHPLSQSQRGFQRSDSIINHLMQMTFQAGVF